MIRKLNQSDNEILLELLNKEKEFNLFILGDVENHGYDKEFQDLWGEFENSKLKAVLMRYYKYYVFYAKGDFDIDGFADIIKSDKNINTLSGKSEIISKFDDILDFKISKKSYFTSLRNYKSLGNVSDDIKLATEKDVDKIINLRNEIEEFRATGVEKASILNSLKNKTSRYYYIEDESGFISMTASVVETKELAMIGAVCTLPSHRGKGLASLCVNKVCSEMIKEGKTPCLFYDNPNAGEIYKRVGFENIGYWTMLIK